MDILRLPAEEAAVRRYVEDLWLPFNRELETVVDDFALADDVDVVAAELEYRLDRLESAEFRAWVAVDGPHDGPDLAEPDVDLAGFVTTDLDGSSVIFDRPTASSSAISTFANPTAVPAWPTTWSIGPEHGRVRPGVPN